MREPLRIHLASPAAQRAPLCECLESAAPVADVVPLLEAHGVCGGVARDCRVSAKRSDGSAIAAAIELGDSLQSAGDKIAAALVRPQRACSPLRAAVSKRRRTGAVDELSERLCVCRARRECR